MTARPSRGYTLVELVAALAIGATLLGAATQAVSHAVQKARRSDAQASLGTLALRLQRCNAQFGRFDAAECSVVSPQASAQGWYWLAVSSSAETFTITATPRGAQAGDARCASFSLDASGRRSATGSAADSCW